MRNDEISYVVVTPVRDEEAYLPFTIDSMVKQTIRPQEWIIVNDGSKDKTGQIIEEAASRHSWIRGVHCADRGYRKWGAGIIEAFYAGFNALTCRNWDFMSKLDGDLSFGAGLLRIVLSEVSGELPRSESAAVCCTTMKMEREFWNGIPHFTSAVE